MLFGFRSGFCSSLFLVLAYLALTFKEVLASALFSFSSFLGFLNLTVTFFARALLRLLNGRK